MIDSTAHISVITDNDTVTVVGGGTLDFTNCGEFSEGLRQASRTAENVIVDLREAYFIDTQIAQDIARAAVTLLDRGKRLKVLVSKEKYPLRVIKISGFEQILDVEIESAA